MAEEKNHSQQSLEETLGIIKNLPELYKREIRPALLSLSYVSDAYPAVNQLERKKRRISMKKAGRIDPSVYASYLLAFWTLRDITILDPSELAKKVSEIRIKADEYVSDLIKKLSLKYSIA